MYAIIFHGHQKLDRVAYRHLKSILPDGFFPDRKQILHFEGGKGPDGAKLKRHKQMEQPWHFIDPEDNSETELHKHIREHYQRLVIELQSRDQVRSAFEAAWLAHALVDGLTPAHHYPYEQELAELRGGEDRNSRKGLAGRLFVKGDNAISTVKKSAKLVGPGGLLTSHAMFEAGAYMLIEPLALENGKPTKKELHDITKFGIIKTFNNMANEIFELELYKRFISRGWTQTISQDVRKELAPRIVKMITLSWYAASVEAGVQK